MSGLILLEGSDAEAKTGLRESDDIPAADMHRKCRRETDGLKRTPCWFPVGDHVLGYIFS
jgi:hypothetical protein